MRTFSDIFKKSFIEGFSSSDISYKTAIIALAVTTILAIYIFFVYRVITRKTFYSKTFNIALAGIALITAAIILTIQSNIVVSLGMVGALSIVRFRTAIKDPMDLMFLFWSISIGIICGVGLGEIAVVLSLFITVLIIGLDKLPVAKAPLMLVVNAKNIEAEDDIMTITNKYSKHNTIKSRNATSSSLDLIIELRTSDGKDLLEDVMRLENVNTASLLAHDGEVTF